MAESIGVIIGFLFVIVWLPLAGWQVGKASGDMLVAWMRGDEDHRKPTPQKDPIPKRETVPKKLSRKSSKSSYPVVEEYRDEYKISNPIDF